MYVVELSDTKPKDLLEVRFKDTIPVKCVLGEPILFQDEKNGVGLYRVYEGLSESSVYEKVQFLSVESRFDYYFQYGEDIEVYLGDSQECPAKLLFLNGILEKLDSKSKGTIDISNPKEGYFKEKIN
jgi:hypothetical protein